ncbi:MAG TPA: DUF6600 domain-containing protein [Steroidobacteraceae bacterium]|nr:DUF6600 domain-containing protein [Steroidobacteraceae bacterium]
MSVPAGLFAVALLVACAARAQDAADPPARAARLSVAEGSVSLQPAGLQDWTAAGINRPLTTGDRLWTDQGSRAEIDLGAAVARLGEQTGFAFLNLDDSAAQMQLSAGTLIVRVRDLQPSQLYEIDTPNLAVTLVQPGEYRVQVSASGDSTRVKVTEGVAEASGGGQLVAINAQQTASFTGAQSLSVQSAWLADSDDFDLWSAARERSLEDSSSREYVAGDLPGTQDLDDNGHWESTPEYGYVWVPTLVLVGWVPYRFGHWCWIAPWGWTWIDDARWGYAPFHYGRWVRRNSNWAWVPGPRRARPVYAPALVGWVHGPGIGGSVAFGSNVGWFPLGPREMYEPPYRVSPGYARNVNQSNTLIISPGPIGDGAPGAVPRHYVNNTSAAVTSVTQDVFISGQRVGGHALRVAPAVLVGTAVAASAPAVAPVRQSVLGPNGARGTARPPPLLANRAVVAFTEPPRPAAPFERQLEAMQANGGRPLLPSEATRLATATSTAVRLVAPRAGAPRQLDLRTPAPRAPPSEPTFAERARALQNSALPAQPRARYPDTAALPEGAPAGGRVEPADTPATLQGGRRAASPPPAAGVAPRTPPSPSQAVAVADGTGQALYRPQPLAPLAPLAPPPPPPVPATPSVAAPPPGAAHPSTPTPEAAHYRNAPAAPSVAAPSPGAAHPSPSASAAAHAPSPPPARDTGVRPQ